MHVYLVVFLLSVILLESVGAQERERRRREPIYYDSTIQWHTPDASVQAHVPAEDRIRPEHRERLVEDQTERFFSGEAAAPPMPLQRQLMLPPPAPAEERRSRNWIVPSLDEFAGPRLDGDADEAPEPSGWGWLYDAMEARQRMEMERDDELRDREEQSEQAEEVARRTQRGGLMEDGSVFQAMPRAEPQTPLLRDIGPEERDAVLSAIEQVEAAARETERMDDPDPWETRAMSQSVWEQDSTFVQSEHVRSALVSPFGQSAEAEASVSRFQSGRGTTLNNGGLLDDEARRATETGMPSTRVGNNDAIWGERSSSTATPSPFTPAGTGGWSANWSGDSGWQGQSTAIEPVRSSITPVVSPTAPLHDTGRLASP